MPITFEQTQRAGLEPGTCRMLRDPHEKPDGTIVIDNLSKSYGTRRALDGVTLSVPAGQLFAYLGPNGAGKSTTIRILTGLTRLGEGRVLVGGHDIVTDGRAAKRQCGLVPQHVNLDGDLTVRQNLDIHGRLFAMDRSERRVRTAELLSYVELDDRSEAPVFSLSGGMKRRLMIARALLHRPKVLFLDEPTAGLDAAIRRRIWALIRKVQQDGTTVFLTTHHIEEAEFLAERVAFLDEGRIVTVDTPTSLINGIGAWAVDRLTEDGMRTEYFLDRQDAQKTVANSGSLTTIRRVNLEDAFLAMTGKKV